MLICLALGRGGVLFYHNVTRCEGGSVCKKERSQDEKGSQRVEAHASLFHVSFCRNLEGFFKSHINPSQGDDLGPPDFFLLDLISKRF